MEEKEKRQIMKRLCWFWDITIASRERKRLREIFVRDIAGFMALKGKHVQAGDSMDFNSLCCL